MIRQPKSRSTAEHPFGTIKCWMGATHCLVGTVMARRNAIEIAINIYLEQCCRPEFLHLVHFGPRPIERSRLAWWQTRASSSYISNVSALRA